VRWSSSKNVQRIYVNVVYGTGLADFFIPGEYRCIVQFYDSAHSGGQVASFLEIYVASTSSLKIKVMYSFKPLIPIHCTTDWLD